jgi:phospholipid/cholesterol/gamma-HCH transport system substrate-binding protein
MEVRARYVLIGLFVLLVVAGGFGFSFWLNRSGGLGAKSLYRVRFEASVAGLLLGSDVLFNGIRVGEVTALAFDREKPADVIATIAVQAATPIRTDTRIGLDFGGLTGTASIALYGGAADAPPLQATDGELPALVADSASMQDWTDAARSAFGRVDSLMVENSAALHEVIANINTFAEALARNSDRIDTIVAGLDQFASDRAAGPPTVYDLTAPTAFGAGLAIPSLQLVVWQPSSVTSLDTQAFLVGSGESEDIAFEGSKWSDSIPSLFRARIIETFENAGYFRTGGEMQGLTEDRRLLTDIRTFRVTTGEPPIAEVDLSAKLVSADGRVLDARTFHAAEPVAEMAAPAAAAALNKSFGRVAADLVTWALQIP